ncbi:MAG TPA: class I SAM-dependent methyltransferase [Burkholderiales bacterium]|nr:class I SAM-dependent methyltransferase [Burkholderiales bacterium]
MLRTATQAQMLLNRVAKNFKHLKRWARREGIECFRVYDRDIPELPFALDVYGQSAQLQEYSAPIADVRAQREWRSAMHGAAAQALEMSMRQVVLKQRHGQSPEAQYRKLGPREDFIVSEGGHRFIVNLTEYLDTGLFLDHRETRARVQGLAKGGHVLNLFCYTGSFSVYAAAGGAKTTTSVDLSNSYLDWARRNFELNGMDAGRHRLIRADARRFVRDEAAAGQRYDLIVLDPPSFSNSKRMEGVLAVQRDHVALIHECIELLAREGELLFATNLRSFRLDAAALTGLKIAEISSQTVPPDFRNRKIHKCWRICRGEGRGEKGE